MNIDSLDIESLKRALIDVKKKERDLDRLMRPLRAKRDKMVQLESNLAHILQTLDVNADELLRSVEAEPTDVDISQLMHMLREELLSIPAIGQTMKPADAAYLVLQSIGRPTHYKEIVSAMRERGFSVPGDDPNNNLLAHMSNDKERFAKAKEAGRGFWKLAEWDNGD